MSFQVAKDLIFLCVLRLTALVRRQQKTKTLANNVGTSLIKPMRITDQNRKSAASQ